MANDAFIDIKLKEKVFAHKEYCCDMIDDEVVFCDHHEAHHKFIGNDINNIEVHYCNLFDIVLVLLEIGRCQKCAKCRDATEKALRKRGRK